MLKVTKVTRDKSDILIFELVAYPEGAVVTDCKR